MQLILALVLAVQSTVVLAATTADEEAMDKATLFYECLRTVAAPNETIEEETHTRFFCQDKVDHTHHTPQQISADAEKWIADQHRRCAGAAQDDVSCMLWRYDPASPPYIKCLALAGTETDKDFLMNYCVVADREFQQCTQANEGKVTRGVIEEYCLSGKVNGRDVFTQCTQANEGKGTSSEIEEYCRTGKVNGRDVNAQRPATNSEKALGSPGESKVQHPTHNVASTGDLAKSFLAFLGAIYAIGTIGPILLMLAVLLIAAVLLLIGRIVSSLKWSTREVAQFFMLRERGDQQSRFPSAAWGPREQLSIRDNRGRNMLEKLKPMAMGIGGLVGFFAAVVGVIALGVLGFFLKFGVGVAVVWVLVKLYPILVDVMKIMVLLFIVLFLPLSVIRRVRPVSGRVAMAIAWLVGLILVIECGLITYQNWGWIGAVVGFVFFGVGLILFAVLSSLFAGNWTPLGEVGASVALIALFAGAGKWILSKAQPK